MSNDKGTSIKSEAGGSSRSYQHLLEQISATYTQGRIGAMQAVNTQLLETYWQVGRHIVEFEQGGKIRADYGASLISSLAKDLGLRHGKGFSRSNLIRVRQFYLAYPKSATLSHQLSWSHIIELLKIDDPLERSFYEQQCGRERWSVRELIRQFCRVDKRSASTSSIVKWGAA